MRKVPDMTGRRFGRWTVLAMYPERYRSSGYHCLVLWLCRCACGAERVVLGTHLRRGKSRSCGDCIRGQGQITHGHTRGGKHTRVYSIWNSMLQRCFNPNNTAYRYYGGRGITVCERWLTFVNFYADMGDPPPGMSLDRINVDGNYEPGNCRWATRSQQNFNRRPSKARRADVAEIRKFAASLARAASAPSEVRRAYLAEVKP